MNSSEENIDLTLEPNNGIKLEKIPQMESIKNNTNQSDAEYSVGTISEDMLSDEEKTAS